MGSWDDGGPLAQDRQPARPSTLTTPRETAPQRPAFVLGFLLFLIPLGHPPPQPLMLMCPCGGDAVQG